jgi:hypothetical protein
MVTIEELKKTRMFVYCNTCHTTYNVSLHKFIVGNVECNCYGMLTVLNIPVIPNTVDYTFGNPNLDKVDILNYIPRSIRYDYSLSAIYKVMEYIRRGTSIPKLDQELTSIFNKVEQW